MPVFCIVGKYPDEVVSWNLNLTNAHYSSYVAAFLLATVVLYFLQSGKFIVIKNWNTKPFQIVDLGIPCSLGIRIQPTFALVRVVSLLMKGYELSYATASLNAGSSCIQWGI